MNIKKYLNRIHYPGKAVANESSLIRLHSNHVYQIPFENFDIQNNIHKRLEEEHLFNKIIHNKRGGFCYELNFLFYSLLINLGFDAKVISARIFNDGIVGPEFDHMAIIVKIEKNDWLVDVGFGDLFIKPLKMHTGIEQVDELCSFKIELGEKQKYFLSKSREEAIFENIYSFKVEEKKLEQFFPQCKLKQESPLSYFVQNKICTLPIAGGRKTLFNSKYKETKNKEKLEVQIDDEMQARKILSTKFYIGQ